MYKRVYQGIPFLITLTVLLATTPAPAQYTLQVSSSSDRQASIDLVGQIVSGDIYVFVRPETGINQVNFYLDDPTRIGAPIKTENIIPWDFQGGSAGSANPYDNTQISNDFHTITAAIRRTDKSLEIVHAQFQVNQVNNVILPGMAFNPSSIDFTLASDESDQSLVQQ